MYIHNFLIVKAVFVLSLVFFSCAEIRTRCGNGTETNLTFVRSEDGVLGRYTAELCTNITRNITDWKLDVTINAKDGYCNQTHHKSHPGSPHSQFHDMVNFDSINCPYVCLSTDFDLIFDSCYLLKSAFRYGKIYSMPYDSYHRIVNEFSFGDIISAPKYTTNNYDDGVSVHLYPGVPPTEYGVDLCNNSNDCESVSRNCSSTPTSAEINCFFTPPYGCYTVVFTFYAPWTSGIFNGKSFMEHDFCYRESQLPRVSGNSWGVVWACAGVLALCASAFAARRGWQTRAAHKLREQVRRAWVSHRNDNEVALEPGKSACKHVLLLYARECEAGQRVIALLKQMLAEVISGTVLDLYSAETLSAAAAAPAQFVRGVIDRADVAVLVLQTPALACLHAAALRPPHAQGSGEPAFTMEQPLLGRAVAPRAPHFGDGLLHLALRQMQESAHHQDAYLKYYLAQLSDLKVEMFPGIVRFARYPLPGATGVLLRDLCGRPAMDAPQPPQPLLAECADAVARFVRFAAENPDYLSDQLVFAH